jgi:hypothetical protein
VILAAKNDPVGQNAADAIAKAADPPLKFRPPDRDQ